jgi:hypothetical protein
VDNLAPKMRQKVLRGKGDESSDDDDVSEGDEIQGSASWGKKKKTYWEGDTGDLEIGQDVADADDEEAAVKV